MKTIFDLAHDFLSQPSIAVVGISSSRQTVANGVYKKLKKGNRKTFAVGKNTASFDGDSCYPALSSLPAAVDGVFIAAKPENTEHVIEECIRLNIPRIWIHNMGGTSKSDSCISAAAMARCKEKNIAVIPGACPMMFVNDADGFHKCVRWFLRVSGNLKM
jgi:uncharacterized protein